jgi:hypothetical protein
MKEQYDNATGTTSYVYENSKNAYATVGTEVTASSAPGITLNGYEKNAEMNAESTATIAADGSSVLLVYYRLIRYTFVFDANGGTINIGGKTYTGRNYRLEDLVIGKSVLDVWPSSSDEITA